MRIVLYAMILVPLGSLQVRGQEYTAFAYWTQVMDTFGGGDVWWINVVGIANDGSNLAIVYLDCTNGKLQNGFWEEDWYSSPNHCWRLHSYILSLQY